tara:strand:+ start:14644 stop:14865 length:222 start_codon:yes stop_codon:yes gene_type:complete
MSNIRNIIKVLLTLDRAMLRDMRSTAVITTRNAPRTSPNTKLKLQKPKVNKKYKSSKPLASKVNMIHRNKANI